MCFIPYINTNGLRLMGIMIRGEISGSLFWCFDNVAARQRFRLGKSPTYVSVSLMRAEQQLPSKKQKC